MTISFNTIPSNTLVPLFYAEMDNQAANTAQDSGASLLIGHANNGAEIVANSLVLMPSADYARQICGAGSQLARMVEAYRQTDPFGELYVIAVPEATGAAATVTLTVTGQATETGTVNVYVGRTRLRLSRPLEPEIPIVIHVVVDQIPRAEGHAVVSGGVGDGDALRLLRRGGQGPLPLRAVRLSQPPERHRRAAQYLLSHPVDSRTLYTGGGPNLC